MSGIYTFDGVVVDDYDKAGVRHLDIVLGVSADSGADVGFQNATIRVPSCARVSGGRGKNVKGIGSVVFSSPPIVVADMISFCEGA